MLTLKTQNKTFVDLINGLFAVHELPGVRFSLAVSKNIRILQKELQDLESAAEASDEFKILAAKVNAAQEDTPTLSALEAENEELIQERVKQLTEVDLLMEEEVEIQLHPISVDVLPEQISALQITNIDKLITE